MLKLVFGLLGMVMVIVFVLTWAIAGEFNPVNMHLAAYGFILSGIGYIIELQNRKNKDSADYLRYVMVKNNRELYDEIRSIRSMILKLDERRGIDRGSEALKDSIQQLKKKY